MEWASWWNWHLGRTGILPVSVVWNEHLGGTGILPVSILNPRLNKGFSLYSLFPIPCSLG
ncbi:MAG: hypothetical protein F6J98_37005 [Moorea sp. SIO4G2]|nr:hypothetical protein [Moorena sp. SIO4G2]